MKKYFIHFFVFGIIGGVLIFNSFSAGWTLTFLCLLSSTLILLFLSIYKLKRQSKEILILILVFIISFTLSLTRSIQTNTDSKIIKFNNQKVELIGIIVGEPDIRSFNTRLKVDIDRIETENIIIKTQERVIITVSHFPQYKTGDEIKILGKIQPPQNFENENGIEFDYINYLAKDDIYNLIYYPRVELIHRPKFNINRTIFSIKNNFLKKAQEILPSPESELLGGILLGTKRSLGSDLEEKFRVVGLIHIVVLSGYNVTIIAEFIFRILSFLPKIFSATLGAISIIIFSIMVGSGATVVRSVIMALIALSSRVLYKNYNVNRALFFAGSLMLLHNPKILLHDPSFQLSFLATIGLVNISDFVKKFIWFLPEKFEIREITSATLSTQIAVIPLLIKMTGELSVVAPIVNVLTLQVIPITMLLGFIAVIFGFINQTLGLVFGMIPFLFLNYILKIVEIFSSFPVATIKLI